MASETVEDAEAGVRHRMLGGLVNCPALWAGKDYDRLRRSIHFGSVRLESGPLASVEGLCLRHVT